MASQNDKELLRQIQLLSDAIDQHKSLRSTSGRGGRGGFALGFGQGRSAADAPPGVSSHAPTSRNMKLVLTPQEVANPATNRLLPAPASCTLRRPVVTSAASTTVTPGLLRPMGSAGSHTFLRVVPAGNRASQTPAPSTPKRSTPSSSSSASEYITKRQGKNLQLINKAVLSTVAATHAQNVKTTEEKKRKRAQAAAAIKAQRRKARAEALARGNIVNVGGTQYMKSRSGRTIVVAKADLRNVTINGVLFTMDSTGKKLVRAGTKSKCKKGYLCPYAHDPKHVVVCRRHLQDSCSQGSGCPFSHLLVPEKVPLCVHFARGSCSNSECRYLHSRVSPTADVCRAFALENYCPQGARCKQRHVFECPDYRPGEGVEFCHRGKKCKLPHVDTMNRKAPAGVGKRGPVHLDGDRTAKRARPDLCDGGTADRAISLDSDEDEGNVRLEENESLLFPDFAAAAAASLSDQELEDEGESEERDADYDACDERGTDGEPEAEGEQEYDDDHEAQDADYDTDDLLSEEEEDYEDGDVAGDMLDECTAEETLPLVPKEEKDDFGASYLAFE